MVKPEDSVFAKAARRIYGVPVEGRSLEMGIPRPTPETDPTKAERLERDYWTLQYLFEELHKADPNLAIKFLQWGTAKHYGIG